MLPTRIPIRLPSRLTTVQFHPLTLTKMAESSAKRLKTDTTTTDTTMADSSPTPLKIGTHNGHFHADEALAVSMLRLLPAYRNSTLVRTRDPALLATCHTVVDVGGEYNATTNRYDHHQKEFTTTFPGRPTKLSSAGLIYLHFGKAILAQALAAAKASSNTTTVPTFPLTDSTAVPNLEDDRTISTLHPKIYESFIEPLDAHDNGIQPYPPTLLASANITPLFRTTGFTLAATVSRHNPNWNDAVPSSPAAAQAAEDARFEEASKKIGAEFVAEVDYYVRAWTPARDVVASAFKSRKEHDALGRVLVFKDNGCPWKDHMYDCESDANESGSVLYVVYPESPLPGAKWRVQCVPEAPDSFVSRKPLPAAWRGVRDAELDGVAGIEGCVFVHASGFIGGNRTFEGVMEMVRKALE